MDVEQLKKRLEKGEDEATEFKRVFDDQAARTICAFANHYGGLLMIGVDDSGKPVGASKETISRLNSYLGAVHPKPSIRTQAVEIDGKTVYLIWVEPSSMVHRFGDDVFVRVGSSVRKASPEEIAALSAEKGILRFDEAVRRDLQVQSLDEGLVEEYVRLAVRRGRLPADAETWSFKEALNRLKAAVDQNPTNAGIMIFSTNPSKYISNAELRVVIQSSSGSVVDDKRFSEPLWKMVLSVITYLSEKVVSVGWVQREVTRVETPVYPLEALREAIVNAVTHRNYLTEGIVVIKVFPHQITVENPGGFPLGVTPDKPRSRPRNPILCDLMYRVGLVEELGTGIIRMRDACSRSGIVFRVDEWMTDFTRVSFSRTSNYIESEILRLMSLKGPLSTKQLAETLNVSRPTVLKALKNLSKTLPIEVSGKTRNKKYSLASAA